MLLEPLRIALRGLTPALRAVDHLAWWVGWQSRPPGGGGTRLADQRDGRLGEECAAA